MTTPKIDLDKGGIEVMRIISDLPRRPAWASTPGARAELAEEEAVIRDDLVAYGYAYGAMDMEALLAHFADDVAIVTAAGTVTGSDLLRRNYEWLFKDWPGARHLWGEVTVRFVAPDEAYRSAIIWEIYPKNQSLAFSTDIHHLKRLGGRWKIVKRRILMDGSFKLTPWEEERDAEEPRRKFIAEAEKARASAPAASAQGVKR